MMRVVIMLMLTVWLSACSHVAAWERGYLAKPEMQWSTDPLYQTIETHIYFSKEASSGGAALGGGGCGCN